MKRGRIQLFIGGVFFVLMFAAIARATEEQSKFLRFVQDKNGGGTLQASSVRYENADGVTVDLVAAVHIAEKSFFQSLNDSFADYDAVLFELVAPQPMLVPSTQGSKLMVLRSGLTHDAADDDDEDSGHGGGALSWVGSLQHFLKDTLKLTFQLEEIDYRRPNFYHADLDYETFSQLQGERHESFFTLMLQSALHEMARPDAAASSPTIFDLLYAMHAPDRARQLKLLLGKQFSQIDEQMAGMEGPKGSVLVGERNKAALIVLRRAMNAGHKHIAIFYGAAHLKLMDKTLTQEMGFHQVGPPFWRVAWDMTITDEPSTQPTTAPSSQPAGASH